MARIAIITSSFSCRWTTAHPLFSLPAPGTEFFRDLCKRLRPFKIAATGISLQAPSQNLSDVVLSVPVKEGRVTCRTSYDYFEVVAPDLRTDDAVDLGAISQGLIDSLHSIEPDLELSRARINARFHASLEDGDIDSYLAGHLTRSGRRSSGSAQFGLIADGFAFNLVRPTEFNSRATQVVSRITGAKSLFHGNAVFIDFYTEYSPPPSVADLEDSYRRDFDATLDLVDLYRIGDGG